MTIRGAGHPASHRQHQLEHHATAVLAVDGISPLIRTDRRWLLFWGVAVLGHAAPVCWRAATLLVALPPATTQAVRLGIVVSVAITSCGAALSVIAGYGMLAAARTGGGRRVSHAAVLLAKLNIAAAICGAITVWRSAGDPATADGNLASAWLVLAITSFARRDADRHRPLLDAPSTGSGDTA